MNADFIEINLDVKTYDIDVAGHLNNIAYIRWLEDLRIKLFEKYVSIPELLKDKKFPVVAETKIEYKHEINLNDKPVGKMWIERIDKVIIQLKAEILLGDKIAAKACQKCVIINMETKQMLKPSEKFKSPAL
ncbi:MAG TPA: thioesterase family protein [Ignavibacteriales bacterium]|nr:thioesterase family protein [Ignavibacteriales bacterium]